MGNEPLITIVVTCLRRKEYIRDAIESVLTQSIPRAEYEIIVVKDFSDVGIDEFLREKGVRIFTKKQSRIGEYHCTGIRESRGEIVCFLDDDDLYTRNKLSVVKSLFANDPELVYLHNGAVKFTTGEKVGKVANQKTFSIDVINRRSIYSALKKGFDFNSSSISIRKSNIHEKHPILCEVSRGIDTMIFYLSLKEGARIMNTSENLTLYRIHSSASNFYGTNREIIDAKISFLSQLETTLGTIITATDGDVKKVAYSKSHSVRGWIKLFREEKQKISPNDFLAIAYLTSVDIRRGITYIVLGILSYFVPRRLYERILVGAMRRGL